MAYWAWQGEKETLKFILTCTKSVIKLLFTTPTPSSSSPSVYYYCVLLPLPKPEPTAIIDGTCTRSCPYIVHVPLNGSDITSGAKGNVLFMGRAGIVSAGSYVMAHISRLSWFT